MYSLHNLADGWMKNEGQIEFSDFIFIKESCMIYCDILTFLQVLSLLNWRWIDAVSTQEIYFSAIFRIIFRMHRIMPIRFEEVVEIGNKISQWWFCGGVGEAAYSF